MTEPGRSEPALPRNPAEWITFGLSALVLAVLIGAVVSFWVRPPTGPPRFTFDRGQVRTEGDRFVLPVRVTNVGGEPATQVCIEGRLAAERPETIVDFLPQGASEHVVLVFATDPAEAVVGVVSYRTRE